MKILLATYWLIPHVGGVWKFMSQIKEHLEAMGHEVDLLGNSPDYKKFHIVNRGLELSKDKLLPLLDSKLDAAKSPLLHLGPHEIIRQYEIDRYCMELSAAYFGLDGYDVIHTQDVFAARAISRVKPKRVPLVAHLHGSVALEMMNHFGMNSELGVIENSPPWRYFNSIEHYGATSSNITITANQWQKNMLVHRHGVPEHQVAVFQYGLDATSFWNKTSLGTPIQRPPGKKVIIFPARLVFVKGINILISALAFLKQIRQDWVCWIVGDGDKQEELQQQVLDASLQQDVLFLGRRDDIPALLLQSDIFVHSCLQDNQPFSVMEAQLAGLPALVSSAGGLPEMVEHGKTGLISPVGDPVTLFHQIHHLLEHDEYRKRLGENAKSWAVQHWSMELMINRLLQVYSAVVSHSV
ncbi:glycosyltransferase family 4 protein [Paenibacillus aurantiacus]|uniref:Glycosyltransferase family 4 protein n=1 Tax=Paenibacillus aurantiacus TaxID=1936118 RepID=A0ABV5KZJ2_9BACL